VPQLLVQDARGNWRSHQFVMLDTDGDGRVYTLLADTNGDGHGDTLVAKLDLNDEGLILVAVSCVVSTVGDASTILYRDANGQCETVNIYNIYEPTSGMVPRWLSHTPTSSQPKVRPVIKSSRRRARRARRQLRYSDSHCTLDETDIVDECCT
jgi:hypothetical protein